LAFALSVLFSGIVIFSVQKRVKSDAYALSDNMRVPTLGMVAVGSTTQDDAGLLSRRLVLYPLIILVSGLMSFGMSAASSQTMKFIGIFVLGLGGVLNTLAFFSFDPSARKLAQAMLEILAEHDKPKPYQRVFSPTSIDTLTSPTNPVHAHHFDPKEVPGLVPTLSGTAGEPHARTTSPTSLSRVNFPHVSLDRAPARRQAMRWALVVARGMRRFLRWVGRAP
ncbi:hypothetical protein HDU93_000525, partial [Gonapodya sp. JEL0774]